MQGGSQQWFQTLPAMRMNPQEPIPQDSFFKLSEEKNSDDTCNPNLNSNLGPPADPQDVDADANEENTSASLGVPTEDGYSWHKYGHKQVKASEYLQSYYKCAHPNCKVKKKVGRSHDSQVTKIIYKGLHNHLKSSPSRKSLISSSHSGNDLLIDASEQNDQKQDASIPMEQCQQSNPVQSLDVSHLDSLDGIEASSIMSIDDEEVEQGTQESLSLSSDRDGDEMESKRRKLDACALEISAASRGVREPRIVIQTTSEIDILDDGYNWRKYGQKVVKGNPNPRSYYRCTNPGCTIRKHVERASHDLKSVITTYEGKHNHGVPTARTGNQGNSAASPSIATTSSTSSYLLQRNTEPARIPDCLGSFDTPAALGSFHPPSRYQQLGTSAPIFSYPSMTHEGFDPNFSMSGLENMASLNMSVFPWLHAFRPQRRPGSGVDFVMPNIAPREEPDVPPVSDEPDGSSIHQLHPRTSSGP